MLAIQCMALLSPPVLVNDYFMAWLASSEKNILATENMSGMTVPHVVLISRVGTKKDRANYSLPLKY